MFHSGIVIVSDDHHVVTGQGGEVEHVGFAGTHRSADRGKPAVPPCIRVLLAFYERHYDRPWFALNKSVNAVQGSALLLANPLLAIALRAISLVVLLNDPAVREAPTLLAIGEIGRGYAEFPFHGVGVVAVAPKQRPWCLVCDGDGSVGGTVTGGLASRVSTLIVDYEAGRANLVEDAVV